MRLWPERLEFDARRLLTDANVCRHRAAHADLARDCRMPAVDDCPVLGTRKSHYRVEIVLIQKGGMIDQAAIGKPASR